jgi:hypothetical protein
MKDPGAGTGASIAALRSSGLISKIERAGAFGRGAARTTLAAGC